MHACHSVCAGRPTRAGDMAKSGQFIGQLSWVTGDPIGLKGLTDINARIFLDMKSEFDNG